MMVAGDGDGGGAVEDVCGDSVSGGGGGGVVSVGFGGGGVVSLGFGHLDA